MITLEQLAASGSEDGHCKALMAWCALNIKKYPELKWLSHIPNGGARDIREGAKFKGMGVRKGIPDYFLPMPIQSSWGDQYAGLWIEMKVGNNKLSIEQSEWIAHLNSIGYKAYVCYGWEAAKQVIEDYFKLIER